MSVLFVSSFGLLGVTDGLVTLSFDHGFLTLLFQLPASGLLPSNLTPCSQAMRTYRFSTPWLPSPRDRCADVHDLAPCQLARLGFLWVPRAGPACAVHTACPSPSPWLASSTLLCFSHPLSCLPLLPSSPLFSRSPQFSCCTVGLAKISGSDLDALPAPFLGLAT